MTLIEQDILRYDICQHLKQHVDYLSLDVIYTANAVKRMKKSEIFVKK